MDPFGFGRFAEAMSSSTLKRIATALTAASMALGEGETVNGLIDGEFLAHDAVAVLTDRRVLFINGRAFSPDQASISLSDLSDVKGWIEANRATLQMSGGGVDLVIGEIREVERAQAFAGEVRSHL